MTWRALPVGEPSTIFIHLGALAWHGNCSETLSVSLINASAQWYETLVKITLLSVQSEHDLVVSRLNSHWRKGGLGHKAAQNIKVLPSRLLHSSMAFSPTTSWLLAILA